MVSLVYHLLCRFSCPRVNMRAGASADTWVYMNMCECVIAYVCLSAWLLLFSARLVYLSLLPLFTKRLNPKRLVTVLLVKRVFAFPPPCACVCLSFCLSLLVVGLVSFTCHWDLSNFLAWNGVNLKCQCERTSTWAGSEVVWTKLRTQKVPIIMDTDQHFGPVWVALNMEMSCQVWAKSFAEEVWVNTDPSKCSFGTILYSYWHFTAWHPGATEEGPLSQTCIIDWLKI